MNKRKSIFILPLVVVIIWSIISTFNYRIAETSKSNKFTIVSDSNSLKLGDSFSVTLVGEFFEPEDAVQGRIEYSDDIEVVEEQYYNYEEFSNSDEKKNNGQIALGENNAIGFAIVRYPNDNGTKDAVIGTKKIITFTFKVKSSLEKNVEIKWKGKDKNGLYDIASISLPRSDVAQSTEDDESQKEENKNPSNENSEQNKTNENGEQNKFNENSEQNKVTQNITEEKNKISIPQTGESYLYIILGLIVMVVGVILYKIYKKNKF
ncbi:MAG: LPXTG cell wall anchor domain-containing protein [Clostridia bacterium]|nr:LPXTG cell wall anchor domain-containing protein [Clostridia bacterium]